MKISRGKIYKILHSRNQTKKIKKNKQLGKRKNKNPRTYNKRKRKHLRYKSLKDRKHHKKHHKKGGARLVAKGVGDSGKPIKELQNKVNDYSGIWVEALKTYVAECKNLTGEDVGSASSLQESSSRGVTNTTEIDNAISKLEVVKKKALTTSGFRSFAEGLIGKTSATESKEEIAKQIQLFIDNERALYNKITELRGGQGAPLNLINAIRGMLEANKDFLSTSFNGPNNKSISSVIKSFLDTFTKLVCGPGINAEFDLLIMQLEKQADKELKELKSLASDFRLSPSEEGFDNLNAKQISAAITLSSLSMVFGILCHNVLVIGENTSSGFQANYTVMGVQSRELGQNPPNGGKYYRTFVREISEIEETYVKEMQEIITTNKLVVNGMRPKKSRLSIEGEGTKPYEETLIQGGGGDKSGMPKYKKFFQGLDSSMKKEITKPEEDDQVGNQDGSLVEMREVEPSAAVSSGSEEKPTAPEVSSQVKATAERLFPGSEGTASKDEDLLCSKPTTWDNAYTALRADSQKAIGLCNPDYNKEEKVVENKSFEKINVLGDSNCGWYSIAEYIYSYSSPVSDKKNEAWLTIVLKDANEQAKKFIEAIRDADPLSARQVGNDGIIKYDSKIVGDMKEWVSEHSALAKKVNAAVAAKERGAEGKKKNLKDSYLNDYHFKEFADLLKTTICSIETDQNLGWAYTPSGAGCGDEGTGVCIDASLEAIVPPPPLMLINTGKLAKDQGGGNGAHFDLLVPATGEDGKIFNIFESKTLHSEIKQGITTARQAAVARENIYGASNQGNTPPPGDEASSDDAKTVDKASSDAAKTDDKCKSTVCNEAKGFDDFYKTLGIDRPKKWSPAFRNYMQAAFQNKLLKVRGRPKEEICVSEAQARFSEEDSWKEYDSNYTKCGGTLQPIWDPPVADTSPTQEPGPTSGPAQAEGSTSGPAQAEGSTSGPAQAEGSTSVPAQAEGQTSVPAQAEGQTSGPAQQGAPPQGEGSTSEDTSLPQAPGPTSEGPTSPQAEGQTSEDTPPPQSPVPTSAPAQAQPQAQAQAQSTGQDGSVTTTHARINNKGQLVVTITAVLPEGTLMNVTGPGGSNTEAVLKGVVDNINQRMPSTGQQTPPPPPPQQSANASQEEGEAPKEEGEAPKEEGEAPKEEGEAPKEEGGEEEEDEEGAEEEGGEDANDGQKVPSANQDDNTSPPQEVPPPASENNEDGSDEPTLPPPGPPPPSDKEIESSLNTPPPEEDTSSAKAPEVRSDDTVPDLESGNAQIDQTTGMALDPSKFAKSTDALPVGGKKKKKRKTKRRKAKRGKQTKRRKQNKNKHKN